MKAVPSLGLLNIFNIKAVLTQNFHSKNAGVKKKFAELFKKADTDKYKLTGKSALTELSVAVKAYFNNHRGVLIRSRLLDIVGRLYRPPENFQHVGSADQPFNAVFQPQFKNPYEAQYRQDVLAACDELNRNYKRMLPNNGSLSRDQLFQLMQHNSAFQKTMNRLQNIVHPELAHEMQKSQDTLGFLNELRANEL